MVLFTAPLLLFLVSVVLSVFQYQVVNWTSSTIAASALKRAGIIWRQRGEGHSDLSWYVYWWHPYNLSRQQLLIVIWGCNSSGLIEYEGW